MTSMAVDSRDQEIAPTDEGKMKWMVAIGRPLLQEEIVDENLMVRITESIHFRDYFEDVGCVG